jgi:hypothetical protein
MWVSTFGVAEIPLKYQEEHFTISKRPLVEDGR